MTKQKSFKRRVRARMEKTRESYSAARLQLLAKAASSNEAAVPGPAQEPASPADTGVEGTRKSDAAVMAKTGRGLTEWFLLLDEWGAAGRKHPEIARWLVEEQGVPGWWAQNITVAYEQARGMRVPGQGADGSYAVSASKTVGVPVKRLFQAFEDEGLRARWLPGNRLEVTTSRSPKSFRAKWLEDDSRVVVGFVAKGDHKSQVAIQHERLSSPEAAKQMKAFWAEKVQELKNMLES